MNPRHSLPGPRPVPPLDIDPVIAAGVLERLVRQYEHDPCDANGLYTALENALSTVRIHSHPSRLT